MTPPALPMLPFLQHHHNHHHHNHNHNHLHHSNHHYQHDYVGQPATNWVQAETAGVQAWQTGEQDGGDDCGGGGDDDDGGDGGGDGGDDGGGSDSFLAIFFTYFKLFYIEDRDEFGDDAADHEDDADNEDLLKERVLA